MAAIWDLQNKYETWLAIELLVCEARVKMGAMSEADLAALRGHITVNVDRIDQIELAVHHDVIAFLTSLTEQVGDAGRHLHFGMTSSDLLDTALACFMKQAADILIADLNDLLQVLKRLASAHKRTLMIGRSHGMHGEPITWGMKMALWYDETQRNMVRMQEAKKIISFGKCSGSMGTYAHLPPAVEQFMCDALGLLPEPVGNQIIQRDRHAQYLQTLALIASSIEKFATEIRHLQRTEVSEVEEPFSAGQKGSSSMPHKRNPIGCENLSGLARVIRGNAQAALENIPLWHERDISHSSVERIILPDSTLLLDFMLHRFTKIMEGLVVYPDRMARNLALTGGMIFSQNILLMLVQKGMAREAAYEIVQQAAHQNGSFKEALLSHSEIVLWVTPDEIEAIFNPHNALAHIDVIYQRVFV